MAKFQELESAVVSLDKQVKQLTGDLQSLITVVNSNSKSQVDLANKTKAVTTATTQISAVEKELESIRKRGLKVTKETVTAKEQLRQRTKALTDEVRKEQGTFKKSGGLFRSMTKSILAAGAAMLGFRTVINVFKKVITTLTGFEKAMSKVKAITNATDNEFKELRKDALRLGSTTSKTATQVAELQTEFAKLGFSTQEILAATEATIQLSIAAGTDLANAAQVAGATVRGFGLSANETQRVVDVMAKSFASSALDLEKFKIIMATVAPVAKASGKDIEFVTAQASKLADAGMDASTAGTSLRNMFLELNKQGLTWEEGLDKINNSTNKNVTSLDLFGKRGATAGLILAENVKQTGEFEIALDGAAGAAKDMADIMEDNLSGELDRTKSKWEGFIQSLESGEGGLATTTRGLVKLWGAVAEGFEILATGREAFLAKQIEAIWSEDINKRVAEDLRIRKEQVGVDQAIAEFKEDEAANILHINELEQQLLELSDRRKDKDKKRILESEIIETKVLASVLAKTIAAEEDAIKVKVDAEEEVARIKLQISTDAEKERKEAQLKIDEEVYNEKASSFQDFVKKREEEELKADQASIERQQKQLELELELYKQSAEDQIALAQEVADEEEALRVKKLENIATGLDFIGNVSQELFDLQNSLADSEISNLERQRDAEVAAAEKAGKDTSKIEEKYAKKESQLRTEQAKKEKAQALFSIGLKTAMAAVASLAVNPLPYGAGILALTIALGAVQLAAAAAKPIPKFKHGSDGMLQLDTEAIVGDGYKPELVVDKHGNKSFTPAVPTRTILPAGSTVFGGDSPETKAALSGGMTQEMYQGLLNEQRLTRQAILSKPAVYSYTPKGLAHRDNETRTDIEWIKNTMRG